MNSGNLYIYLYNIGKISSEHKISAFFASLHHSKPQIIGLTEFDLPQSTPLRQNIIQIIENQDYFLIDAPSGSRVRLLIHNSSFNSLLHFNRLSSHLPSPYNHYITDIELIFDDQPLHICLLYIPTAISNLTTITATSFFNVLRPITANFNFQQPIFMGDWNCGPGDPLLHFLKEMECYDVIQKAPRKLRDKPTNIARPGATNRRLDRFYMHKNILDRHRIRYKLYNQPTRSTHFPVSITIKERSRRKQKQRNIHFPQQHYSLRCPPIPNYLLKDPEFTRLLFKPTTIWQDDIKLSFEFYTKTITERSKKLIKMFKEIHGNPSEEDLKNNLEGAHSGNFLSPTFKELNSRFTKFLDQTTFSNPTIAEATSFFRNLYSDRHEADPHTIIDFIHRQFNFNLQYTLSRADQAALSAPFTLDEIHQTLKELVGKGPSSPGDDGITYQAWYQGWDFNKEHILSYANYLLFDASMTHSPIFDVLIKLIPKKNFNPALPQASCLRPISLTNTSYRLINYMLTKRSMPLFDKIISNFQQAFITGRDMHLHIQSTRLVANYIHQHDKPHSMLLLDIAKAFDTVSHNFIRILMNKAGFPQHFINTIIVQSSCGNAHLLNGNRKSLHPISLKRGVRQGLPISPLIFNLCIEPLIYRLDKELQGIIYNPLQVPHASTTSNGLQLLPSSSASPLHPNFEGLTQIVKVQAFADDLIIFNNDVLDIKKALSLCKQFGTISGLRLNPQKSTIFGTDCQLPQLTTSLPGQIPIAAISDNPIYLGIPILYTNWKAVFDSLIARCRKLLFMDLKLHTIILGINTYILSTIYFRDQHDPAPSDQIDDFMKKIKQMIISHIYPPPNIKRYLWYAPRNQGGFGLMDIQQQVLGRRAYFILIALNPYHSKASHPYLIRLLRLEIQLYLQYGLQHHTTKHQAFALIDQELSLDHRLYEGTQPIKFDNAFASSPVHTLPWYLSLIKLQQPHYPDHHEWKYQSADPLNNNIIINVTQRWRNRFGNLHLHRNLVRQAEYLERGEIPPPMEASGAPVDLTLQSDQKVKVEIFNYGLFYKNIPVYVKAWKTMTISLNFTPSSSLLPFFHPEDFFNTTPSTPGFNQIAGVHLKHKYRTRTYPKESEFTGLQPMHLQHAAHNFHSNTSYLTFTTSTWESWSDRTRQEWNLFYTQLSKYLVVYKCETFNVYALQVGLLNKTFYQPCSLCYTNTRDDNLSPLRHTFSNCVTARHIYDFVLATYSIKCPQANLQGARFENVICPFPVDISVIKFYDTFIGFLVYCSRYSYARTKAQEPHLTWLEAELKEIFFFYTSR
ncbi:hypothetical protein B9K06_25375 [Bacillus sp. OG2]|nr:hypothetical protein B9K06_25375 [Bacillus sp. OG2]